MLDLKWEKHYQELKESSENQSLIINQLVDIEWKFGVTASTNAVDKLGNPFLQLKLVYNQGGQLESRHLGKTLYFTYYFEVTEGKIIDDFWEKK